jgi:hypothetical protein
MGQGQGSPGVAKGKLVRRVAHQSTFYRRGLLIVQDGEVFTETTTQVLCECNKCVIV